MANYIDLMGRRFGRLTAQELIVRGRKSYWRCKCDCGKEKVIRQDTLTRNITHSCGCLQKEKVAESGHKNKKHGESSMRLFKIWTNMKTRCLNKNYNRYSDYGGRGIKICDNWLIYENFSKWAKENGYQDNLSIDRIDVNGNYEPSNCRWATMKEQGNNKRTNHFIIFNGETLTIRQWEERYELPSGTIYTRLNHGWSIERAIADPIISGPERMKNALKKQCLFPGCEIMTNKKSGLCNRHEKLLRQRIRTGKAENMADFSYPFDEKQSRNSLKRFEKAKELAGEG
jgi:hypothetical protein